jgi:hypothetical protein
MKAYKYFWVYNSLFASSLLEILVMITYEEFCNQEKYQLKSTVFVFDRLHQN